MSRGRTRRSRRRKRRTGQARVEDTASVYECTNSLRAKSQGALPPPAPRRAKSHATGGGGWNSLALSALTTTAASAKASYQGRKHSTPTLVPCVCRCGLLSLLLLSARTRGTSCVVLEPTQVMPPRRGKLGCRGNAV